MDNLNDIITCLKALTPFVTVAGVLFVYGGNQARMLDPDLATINWVKCFCGPEFYEYITVVTTKWDEFNSYTFGNKFNKSLPALLKDKPFVELFKPAADGQEYCGANVYHHGLDDSEAHPQQLCIHRQATERAQRVEKMMGYYANASPPKLQILREMDSGIPWYQTEAAKALQHNPQHVKTFIEGGKTRVSLADKPKTGDENMIAADIDQGVTIFLSSWRKSPPL